MLKRIIIYAVFLLAFAFAFTGCAKPPDDLAAVAKTSVEKLMAAEGATYAAATELQAISAKIAAAEKDIAEQKEKFIFFRNYDVAAVNLSEAAGQANSLALEMPKRKQAAKDAANAAYTEAAKAILDASTAIASAPKGKGTRADIEALAADLAGVKDMVADATGLISKEKFIEARSACESLKSRADSITAQVEVAKAKAAATKPAKKLPVKK